MTDARAGLLATTDLYDTLRYRTAEALSLPQSSINAPRKGVARIPALGEHRSCPSPRNAVPWTRAKHRPFDHLSLRKIRQGSGTELPGWFICGGLLVWRGVLLAAGVTLGIAIVTPAARASRTPWSDAASPLWESRPRRVRSSTPTLSSGSPVGGGSDLGQWSSAIAHELDFWDRRAVANAVGAGTVLGLEAQPIGRDAVTSGDAGRRAWP